MSKAILFPEACGPHSIIDYVDMDGYSFPEKALDVDYAERVKPRRLPRKYVMFVDEIGHMRGLLPNKVGSYLYETDKHGSPIVGPVLILREDEQGYLSGLSDADIAEILSLVKGVYP